MSPAHGSDNYRLGREIARGGMSCILEAVDQKLERDVAVKVMLPDGDADDAMRQRFLREAAVLATLAHPNIVPIHDIVWENGEPLFYTMKLIRGRTLQAILDDLRDPPSGSADCAEEYTIGRLLSVFRKVCDAMAFAHSRGVLHRDLKPENVMVGEFGEVLVMDWGLAKIKGRKEADGAGSGNQPGNGSSPSSATGDSFACTLDGVVMGTPQFMSPEQAMGRIDDIDERSDIFSLGGILYAILTLRPPVEGKTLHEVLEKVRSASIARPSTVRPGKAAKLKPGDRQEVLRATLVKPLPHIAGGRVPAALSAVVMKALTLEKAHRYQDVSSLSADVEKYQAGFATTAEKAGLLELLRLLILRHKAFTAALAVLLLLSAGFVFKLIQSEDKAWNSAVAAEKSGAMAREQGEAARQALAHSQVSVAEAAFRERDSQAMLAALDAVPADLRNMDWHYLHRHADNSLAAFVSQKGDFPVGVAAHPAKPGTFAVALNTGSFALVEAQTGKRLLEFPPAPRQQQSPKSGPIDLSPDGARMIAGRRGNGSVAIYDMNGGKPLVEWDAAGIEFVRFSQDGTRTLEVSAGNELSVRDASSGSLLWSTKPVLRAFFTPAGEVVTTYFQKISVLNGVSGALVKKLPDLPHYSTYAALSPDGTVLFFGCHDCVVRAMRLADGTIIFEQRLTDHRGYPQVAGDARRVLGVVEEPGGRRSTRVWDMRTGFTQMLPIGALGPIEGVAIHPLTGEAFITGPDARSWALEARPVESELPGFQSTSVFWGTDDVVIGRFVAKLNTPAPWTKLDFPLPDGFSTWGIAAAAVDVAALCAHAPNTTIFIYRRSTSGFALLHTVPAKAPLNLRLSPDAQRLVTTDLEKIVEVIDVASGQRLCQCDPGRIVKLRDLDWLGAGKLVGIGSSGDRGTRGVEEHLILWDAATGRILRDVLHPSAMDALATAPDGRSFAEAGTDKHVRIRDAETLDVIREFRAHNEAVTALAWHPVKPILATASSDLTVRLWNLEDDSLMEEFTLPSGEAMRLAFSPGGTRLACANNVAVIINLESPPPGKFKRQGR